MNAPAPVLLIAGPTASGKSALALRLAEQISGEIVNADSLQLYGELEILTARPRPADLARAPHHLYGVARAADPWSAGRWLAAAGAALAAIAGRGRPAIVVGGTGLYFRVLTKGLAPAPAIPTEVRAEVRRLYEAIGEDAFRARLAETDPAAAVRIAPGDRQRLTRAFEVQAAGGATLSDLHAATRPSLGPGAWRGAVLELARDALHRSCEARLDAMLAAGALAEVAGLARLGLDPALPLMKAVGLRPLLAHLAGETGLSDAMARAAAETRRYAKRQQTWLRHQAPEWPRIDAADPDRAAAQVLALR